MRILLTGASGKLGVYLIDQLRFRGHEVTAWSGAATGQHGGVSWEAVDLSDARAVRRSLVAAGPDAILHAGAISSAAAVSQDPARAYAVNVLGTEVIASWCGEHDRRLLYTSTDLVFDGSGSWYREGDVPRPVVAYGASKLDGEPSVLATPRGLVARLSLLYGHALGPRKSYFDDAIGDLGRGVPRYFFVDEFRTPLGYQTASVILVRLIESAATGVVHVGGRERMSRFELMKRVAGPLMLDTGLVRPNSRGDAPGAEPRPADVSLDTSRLDALIPDVDRPPPEAAFVQ